MALPAAAGALVLGAGFLWGSSRDEEEYRFTLVTTMIHARALVRGEYPLWTGALGLGMPHPLGQNLLMHPLMPLLAVLRADVWAKLLYAVHAGFGAAGIVMLTRRLNVAAWIQGVAVLTFLLAAPSQNFVLSDFWPSGFVGWTLAPWILLAVWRLIEAEAGRERRKAALATGLLAGLMAANGHPGYVAVHAGGVAFLLAAHVRRIWSTARWWVLAVGVAVAIAAPSAWRIATELGFFPPDLPRVHFPDSLAAASLWDAFLRPLAPLGTGGWEEYTRLRGTRTVFYGGPFALLSIVALARLNRPPFRADLAAGFVGCLALLAVPGLATARVLPATYLFRDPLTLFGLLMAVLALDALWRRPVWRASAAALGAAQVAVMIAAAWPFVHWNLSPEVRAFPNGRSLTGTTAVTERILALTAEVPGRILFSVGTDRLVETGALLRDGLWVNSLVYRNLPVVNGTFKGVSTDSLSPSRSLPYGHIAATAQSTRSKPLLDVLGVRYLIALDDEVVADGLRLVGDVAVRTGQTLRVYRNEDAWPGAAFVDEHVGEIRLARMTGCPHDRVFCADFAPVAAARRADAPVVVSRSESAIRLAFPPAAEPRTLLVAEMYRPGWRARADAGVLPVEPLLGALIGITVPVDVGALDLVYRPGPLAALTVVAWAALAAAAIGVLW